MSKTKSQICGGIKTAAIGFAIAILISCVLLFVFPFLFFGPNDPFWYTLKFGSASSESEIIQGYLNILQWLAFK